MCQEKHASKNMLCKMRSVYDYASILVRIEEYCPFLSDPSEDVFFQFVLNSYTNNT